MMITGRPSAQPAWATAASTSLNGRRGGETMSSFLASHHQVNQIEAPSISPGTMPARKSLEIETLAATPKITKPMLGGRIGAMIPAEAMRPAERALSCPRGQHHRQQQGRQRRGVGDRRARHRREQAGGDDDHVTQPALDVADHHQRHVDDAPRQAADVHHLAGEQEEGHREQRVAVGAVDQVLRQDLRVEHPELPHQRRAADEQGERDRDADRHRREQRADEDEERHTSSSRTITRSASLAWPVTTL